MDVNLTTLSAAIGGAEKWSKQCHAASLAMIRSGLLPEGSRVARGHHPVVGYSQHSWVTTGSPYDRNATIYDATLWSYRPKWTEPHIDVALSMTPEATAYVPHGTGHFMQHGPPPPAYEDEITLDVEWSSEAAAFFTLIGHGLDVRGWYHLAQTPVEGWPAKEIITAMYKDERLKALIPIDIVGMVTDENPGDLYW